MQILLKLTKWVSINSLFTVKNNLNQDFQVNLLSIRNNLFKSKILKIFQTFKLIGQQKELFPELKIKDNVDPAGLLLQLLHVNHGLYFKRKQLIFLNNNQQTALELMELMDVTEDQEVQHLDILKIMVLQVSQHIHIKE